jgi:hypothetical protein
MASIRRSRLSLVLAMKTEKNGDGSAGILLFFARWMPATQDFCGRRRFAR